MSNDAKRTNEIDNGAFTLAFSPQTAILGEFEVTQIENKIKF